MQDWVRDLLKASAGATVHLHDVGAGPATRLGKVWLNRSVVITAVDPLADEYDRILDEHSVKPPVRTKKGDGERLEDVVPMDSFDLVYSINAIDYSYDPLKAIKSMVRAAKPGGWAVLKHNVNEAEHEEYHGLHQWNLCEEKGEFVIWNKQQRTIAEDHLPLAAEVRAKSQAAKHEAGCE